MPRIKIENMSTKKAKQKFANSKTARAPQATTVNSLYNLMASKDLMKGNKPDEQKNVARDAISALNMSIVEGKGRTHTFSTQQEETSLSNKNIINPEIDKLRNQTSSPNEKFVSDTDPFYEMDAAPSVHEQQQIDLVRNKQESDVSQIAQDVYTLNVVVNQNGRKLKQFT